MRLVLSLKISWMFVHSEHCIVMKTQSHAGLNIPFFVDKIKNTKSVKIFLGLSLDITIGQNNNYFDC
jgi:hypothetical protein